MAGGAGVVVCRMFVLVFSIIGEASSVLLVSHSGDAVALDEFESGDGSPFVVLKHIRVSNQSCPTVLRTMD